jgi:nucleotide-binding universal stress UspA family protein
MKTQFTSSSSPEVAPVVFEKHPAERRAPQVATPRHLQLRTIAILTDLGHDSEKSLHYAASLAQRYGSRLLVAHASPADMYPYVSPHPFPAWPAGVILPIEDVREKINGLIAKAGLRNVSIEVVVNQFSIASLLKELEEYRPDLLVLATHGREGIGKLLAGSVTEEVFRKVRWPVLVHGPHTQPEWPEAIEFHKVLCAIDLSDASVGALLHATALAEDNEAQLSVLHVETGAVEGFSFDRTMAAQSFRDWVHSHVLAQGEALQGAKYEIAFGQPEEKILKAALEFKPDVIVIGARGLGAAAAKVASHFVGGTAYEVATRSDCPVLIVPHPR